MSRRKIILIGSTSVGKTSIINRYIDDSFTENEATIVGGATEKKVVANDNEVTLEIQDTAGQEKFRSLTTSLFRNTDIAFVCFNFQDKKSKEDINYWVNEVKEYCPSCILYLVATKIDLIKEESEMNDLDSFLNENKDKFEQIFKTSAKDGTSINDLFQLAATQDINQIEKPDPPELIPTEEEKGENKKCC